MLCDLSDVLICLIWKKVIKEQKISFCIKKVNKVQFVNWEFSNKNKSFENDNEKVLIIVKKSRKFYLSRIKYDHWLISKFSTIFQNSRIISKRMKKMLVNDSMQMKEKKLLLFCLYNRKIAFAWNFSEIDQIKSEIISLMKIRTVFHEIWQIADFFIFKAFQETVIEMLRERMNVELFEKCHDLYRNFWFLIKKKSNKYRMINAAMNINRVTIWNANLSFQMNAFAEEFADMQMISLIDFFSKYDQLSFDKRNRNFIAFMISFELLRMIILSQKAINSVEQFVRIANHILNAHISKKCQTFVNDVVVKKNRNDHENKKIVSEIRIFVLRHIQNLNKILIDRKRSKMWQISHSSLDQGEVRH